MRAIKCETANGSLTLGPRMASLGEQIIKGYDVDLITIVESHLDDTRMIRDAENVTHVWKAEKRYEVCDFLKRLDESLHF